MVLLTGPGCFLWGVQKKGIKIWMDLQLHADFVLLPLPGVQKPDCTRKRRIAACSYVDSLDMGLVGKSKFRNSIWTWLAPSLGIHNISSKFALLEREATGMTSWSSFNSRAILFLQLHLWAVGAMGAEQQHHCAPCHTCCPECSHRSWGSKGHPGQFRTGLGPVNSASR